MERTCRPLTSAAVFAPVCCVNWFSPGVEAGHPVWAKGQPRIEAKGRTHLAQQKFRMHARREIGEERLPAVKSVLSRVDRWRSAPP